MTLSEKDEEIARIKIGLEEESLFAAGKERKLIEFI